MDMITFNRPLFYPECELLSQFVSPDLVLMRFDPLEGASFDAFEGAPYEHCWDNLTVTPIATLK